MSSTGISLVALIVVAVVVCLQMEKCMILFNLRDTEVVICIILVLLKKMDQLLSNTIAIVFFKSLLIDDFNKDCLVLVYGV
jgi:hypothetical protein